MRAIFDDGYTSIQLAKTICEMMSNEGVSNDYIFVTRHYYVRNKKIADKMKLKYIYMAYDSESSVADGSAYDELKYLNNNTPEVIITVSELAYKFFEKQGFNTYYCKIGYNDSLYKDGYNKEVDLGCAWTMDDVRDSTFYHRYVIAKDVAWFMNQIKRNNYRIGNNVPYGEIGRMYGRSLLGINDVIRQVNERCFEIPAGGAVMLVNNQIRKTDYPLKENQHYFVYESNIHLTQLIHKMLNDRENTIKIGERAKKEALKYPQSKFVKEMVDKLGLR